MTRLRGHRWYRAWLAWWVMGNILDLLTTMPFLSKYGTWGEVNPMVTLVFSHLGFMGLIAFKILYVVVFAGFFYFPVPGRKILFALSLAMVWFAGLFNLVILLLMW